MAKLSAVALSELEFQTITCGPPHVESPTLVLRIMYNDFKRAEHDTNKRDGTGDTQKLN